LPYVTSKKPLEKRSPKSLKFVSEGDSAIRLG
jgi:hypothetical protein